MTFPMVFALFLGLTAIGATIHAIVEENTDSIIRRMMGTYFKKFRRNRLRKA